MLRVLYESVYLRDFDVYNINFINLFSYACLSVHKYYLQNILFKETLNYLYYL